MSKAAKKEPTLQELAESIMDIVLKVAARRLVQALEEVNESRIEPLQARITELETALAKARGDQ